MYVEEKFIYAAILAAFALAWPKAWALWVTAGLFVASALAQLAMQSMGED